MAGEGRDVIRTEGAVAVLFGFTLYERVVQSCVVVVGALTAVSFVW